MIGSAAILLVLALFSGLWGLFFRGEANAAPEGGNGFEMFTACILADILQWVCFIIVAVTFVIGVMLLVAAFLFP